MRKFIKKYREWLEWTSLALFLALGTWLAATGLAQKAQVGGESFEEQKEVVIGMQARVQNLDLEKLYTQEEYDVATKLHLGLVAVDSSDLIYPALASSWRVTKNGQEFVFNLRPNLTFFSNRTMSCKDVADTFDYLRAQHDSELWILNLLESYSCRSPSEFVVELKHPSPFFLREISDIRFSIRTFDNGKPHREGLGPYMIDNIDEVTGDIRLRRKNSHLYLNPHSPTILQYKVVENFEAARHMLNTGQLQLYPVRGRLKDEGMNILDSNRHDRIWTFIVGRELHRKFPKLAACLNEHFNRQIILEHIGDDSLSATISLTPLSPSVLIREARESDLDTADQACAFPGLPRLSLLIMDRVDPRIARPLIGELSRLGLHLGATSSLPKLTYLSEFRKSRYDLVLYSVGMGASMATDLNSFYIYNPSFPPSTWGDPESARLSSTLSQAHSDLEARDIASHIVNHSLHNGPIVPLFFENERYLSSRCLLVSNPESFQMNLQFAALAREKGCVD